VSVAGEWLMSSDRTGVGAGWAVVALRCEGGLREGREEQQPAKRPCGGSRPIGMDEAGVG
jgi:hypothetical protein